MRRRRRDRTDLRAFRRRCGRNKMGPEAYWALASFAQANPFPGAYLCRMLAVSVLLAAAAFAAEPQNAPPVRVPAQRAVPVAFVHEEMRLGMRKSGDLTTIEPGGATRTIDTYILTVGDPSREDQRQMNRVNMGLGAFSMDSAQYFHNEDSSWRLYDFRMPVQGESDAFIDFLASPAGESAFSDPYKREDFGKAGDFVYKKMRVEQKDLPAPLNRASTKTLQAIAGIFRFNADGTMKIFLKEPLDQEENAKRVYRQLRKEIERK